MPSDNYLSPAYLYSVQFLFPLFLLAGLTIAIPVLIHLFNLRRYKQINFPHTRFLREIQLRSQKQSQVRYKWLLAARILFLLSLVLAFAQPFFPNQQSGSTEERLQVIYLDNSGSMTVKQGTRSLLEMATAAARRQLEQAGPNARFLLLTNDRPASYQPVAAAKALGQLDAITTSWQTKSAGEILTTVQGILQQEGLGNADLTYYSDFEQSSFPAQADASLTKNIRIHAFPLRADKPQNVYIDTAFLASPVLQDNASNQLIVVSKASGTASQEPPVLQLSVNGQVKSAASPVFGDKQESRDTLSFQTSGQGWQQIMLTVNDGVRFDDTFRITARSSSGLSVLVLNEQQANPFIQTAFRTASKSRISQEPISSTTNWQSYNLIILNGITSINSNTAQALKAAMDRGQTICIFPGKTSDVAAINNGLKDIGDIRFEALEDNPQPVSNLQPGSELVRDIFERIPDNIQLPTTNWHYRIEAGLTANQQAILSFRNGDPFFAQFTPGRGKLFICATAADINATNFPGSYFFVPFLYQMTAQAGAGDVYAATVGNSLPVYVPMNNVSDRNMLHAYAPGVDVIPRQQPSRAGLDVFLSSAITQPGFYSLAAAGADSIAVALNASRAESPLRLWDLEVLKQGWKGVQWAALNDTRSTGGNATEAGFPLWKVCILLALLWLAAETALLAGNLRQKPLAGNVS